MEMITTYVQHVADLLHGRAALRDIPNVANDVICELVSTSIIIYHNINKYVRI